MANQKITNAPLPKITVIMLFYNVWRHNPAHKVYDREINYS